MPHTAAQLLAMSARLPAQWLLTWRERRSAELCCQEMLALYEVTAAKHPWLSGRELYRKVVVLRTGSAGREADAVLDHAEQSYAIWPVSRPLRFRDVVHYLAVFEFCRDHSDLPWVDERIRLVVDQAIPQAY